MKTKIKCVIWDLDNTLWKGVLSEGDSLELNPDIKEIIMELDKRGILQSIASKNNYDEAKRSLEDFDIFDYFVYPQINWNIKSSQIQEIAKRLNFATDSLLFIDDQEFERNEVVYNISRIETMDGSRISRSILGLDELNPKFITVDSANRRHMYQTDAERNKIEGRYKGPKNEFLKTLDLKLTINLANETDLKRAEELTQRTHQLNTTGTIYSFEDLRLMIQSKDYYVLVSELKDKFGSYGKIGLTVIKREQEKWMLELFLMSCRTMSRGIGGIELRWLCNKALHENKKLIARFIPSDRNRIMYLTYKMAGFSDVSNESDKGMLLGLKSTTPFALPDYVQISSGWNV